jgi:gliding motility-associated lipoprotein GldH
MQRRKIRIVFFFFLFTTLGACDRNRIFDQYHSLEGNNWKRDQVQIFEFQIQDTLSHCNLFVNIRNTNEFEFNNIFIRTELEYPNGFIATDTLEYQMADIYGKWLGKGLTDLKENKLYYKENFQFRKSGTYLLKIEQAMRRRNELHGLKDLKGISDVGFRVEFKD